MKVKIKKLSANENPIFPAGNKKDYKVGQVPSENVSLFVDYEVQGAIDSPPEVGTAVRMLRTQRNGVESLGIFATSLINKVEGDKFYTANSIYQWEEVE